MGYSVCSLSIVLDMRVVTLRGRVSFWIIVLGGVLFLFEECSEDIMYLFFSFFLRYIALVHEVLWPFIDIHGTYFLFYIVDVCFSFTYPFMCCFFSPFIHMFLIFVCNLLFPFHTKMPWWVLFKVFQKYRLLKSTCYKLSSCKVFQEFVLG